MTYYEVRGYDRLFFSLDDARKFAVVQSMRSKDRKEFEIDMDTAGGYTTIGEVYKVSGYKGIGARYSANSSDYRWKKYGVGEWIINKNGKIVERIL
ncbi:MAG: hypothetical protein IIY21_06115 [Clostridiales bacterium]|nr:hypothetical protein [Clostridiales bacterium]